MPRGTKIRDTWHLSGQVSCPCEIMHYSGMSFGMSDTSLNLGHVSCMFENMSKLSGLCWNESSIVRKRTIRELRRGRRTRGEKTIKWRRKERKEGRKEEEEEKL